MDNGDGGYDGHIPFRGEVHPKKRAHRSPPRPNEKLLMWIWALLVVLVCFTLAYFAITATTISNVIMSVGGIVFVALIVWAAIDVKRIKPLTSDNEDQKNHHSQTLKPK